jgi:outer membrane protein TolC
VRALLTLLTVLLCGATTGTVAQGQAGRAEPVSLDTVLTSAQTHLPEILESLAERRVAAGEIDAAAGAFDLVFKSEGFDRIDGFYNGRAAKFSAQRPLRALGAKVYSEYKVSDGRLPIYDDIFYTNTAGRLSAGVAFSLLRDREVDARRVAEIDARLALANADLDVLMVRIGMQQRAIMAYWDWVIAGRKLDVYESLLRIALERRSALQQQVETGARARIFLTENQQNIVRRRSLVAAAQRDFENVANRLSFFYRDANGALLVPGRAQLPPQGTAERARVNLPPRDIAVLPEALARRPEIRMLETALMQAEQEIRLRQNDLLPELDLRFEVATALGEVAEGGPSRDTTDNYVGFSFSIPLERRTERARVAQAVAERDALSWKRRRVQQQLEVEIRNIFNNLNYAEQLAGLAAAEVELATAMRRAERQRFEQGASDFFLVNVREEAEADAQIKYLVATLETLTAKADFDAATINLGALGLQANGE